MVQVLGAPPPKGPSFLQSLLGGLSEGVGPGLEKYQALKGQKQQQESIRKAFGDEIAGLPPELQKIYAQEAFKNKFAPQGPKPLTELQQSQKALADERLNALKGQQKLFGQLTGEGQENPSMDQEGKQPSSKGGFENVPDDLLHKTAAFAGQPGEAGIIGNMSKAELERRKEEKNISFQREKLERGESKEITAPLFKELSTVRKNIPLQEQAILDIKEAAPNVSARDYIADVTGFEPLRTAQGAKFKTAIKDFFLSDLSRVGVRPNQWVEQQLADALPKIGRSKEANLIAAEGLQFKVDLTKKRLEVIDRLSETDRNKFGFVKANIESRAEDQMKKYIIDRQKELKDNIEKIKKEKIQDKPIRVRSPKGEIYEIDAKDLDEALKHEYAIIQ